MRYKRLTILFLVMFLITGSLIPGEVSEARGYQSQNLFNFQETESVRQQPQVLEVNAPTLPEEGTIPPKKDDSSVPPNLDGDNSEFPSEELPGVDPDRENKEDDIDIDQSDSIMMLASKTELIISPGDSIKVTNSYSSTISILTDAGIKNNKRYDFVSYGADGKKSSDEMETYNSIQVPGKGGYSIITNDYREPLTASFNPAYITYSYSPVPALLKKTLMREESFRFISIYSFNYAISILSDSISNPDGRYDYAIFKSDGKQDSSIMNTKNHPSLTPNEEIILIGASYVPVTIGVPFDAFIGDDFDEPAYESATLQQGQSYELTNISTVSDVIETDGTTKDKFDYVVYLPDGTESTNGKNTSNKPTVGPGKRVVMTLLTETPVRVGAPYRRFIGKVVEDQAFSRVTLSQGESYIFTNNGSKTNQVYQNAKLVKGEFDYMVYKSDGTYYSRGFNSTNSISIPTGGYAFVTVASASSITFDYTDDFSAEVTDEPAYFRVTLRKGESYEFTNISEGQRYFNTDASTNNRFDSVQYNADGTEFSKYSNTFTATSIFPGRRIVVTAVSDLPVTFGVAYRLFSWKGKNEEAFTKQQIQIGESYVFRNSGPKSITIQKDALSVNGIVDYAKYDSKGIVTGSGYNYKSNMLSIPANGYLIITGQSVGEIIFRYTDPVTAEPFTHPAMLRVTLKQGESYNFNNITDYQSNLNVVESVSGGNGYSFVLTKPDGSISRQGVNKHTYTIIMGRYSAHITNDDVNPITFIVVYSSFVSSPDDDPSMLRVTLNQNNSYMFRNETSKAISIVSDAKSSNYTEYDYVEYAANGTTSKGEINHDGNLSISSGDTIIVTVTSVQPVTFRYAKQLIGEPQDDPAFIKKTLVSQQSAAFKNTSLDKDQLVTNAIIGANRYYDYKIVNADGTLYKEGSKTDFEYPIPAGAEITVKVTSSDPVIVGAPFRHFIESDPVNITFEKLTENDPIKVSKEVGKNGYYLLKATQTGAYRIATKKDDMSGSTVISVYKDPKLQNLIVTSKDSEQIYGADYVVVEVELIAGQSYYIKLNDNSGVSLELYLAAAAMKMKPNTDFEYSSTGELNKIIYLPEIC
ncbi:hypothetical protein [Paenibacillus pini]|uniref:Uncharacterized protein n=1 Tax=Paenibacillus pini JCM 16418 TaxID=1236976 RepID=W7Z337_9BACL|nr:hypothetical protein [Paenibacillus pini]GAF08879.1 hypothetical protein JCM16418_2988 [Paenibacillus pini JCM 16418]